MAHSILGFIAQSVSLITDESDNHAVEVEEEHEEVESQLDKRFLECVTKLVPGLERGKKISMLFKKRNLPSCARLACGKSQWHPRGAGSRRSCARKIQISDVTSMNGW